MQSYQLLLAYNGQKYKGWQKQKTTTETIQGYLERSVQHGLKIFPEDFKTLGSGRTDAGVHAIGQVVKLSILEKKISITEAGLKKALNAYLPKDIRIMSLVSVDQSFHPLASALAKEYHYHFTSQKEIHPFIADFVTYCPFELDNSLIQEALTYLKGRKSFHNYKCVGTPVPHYERTIFDSVLEPSTSFLSPLVVSSSEPQIYTFKIIGEGFLKQMVRLLLSAIWNVGRKKISIQDFCDSFDPEIHRRTGEVLAPQGLVLFKVYYEASELQERLTQ
jgi:tRNA pseudouridine38-40 synthase